MKSMPAAPWRNLVLFAIHSFAVLAVAQQPPQPGKPPLVVVFTNVNVVDVANGAVTRNSVVVVKNGRIQAISRRAIIGLGRDLQVVNTSGRYMIPGLWDMHVHLSIVREPALAALVANGVLGVRDMGGDLEEIDAWRRRIGSGELLGPAILRAGPILDGPKDDAPYHLAVNDAEQARLVVRDLKKRRVDFIKVHNALPRAAYFALLDEARRQGLSVAGHVPVEVEPAEASAAGQRSIEHVQTLFEGTFGRRLGQPLRSAELLAAMRQFEGAEAAELFRRFAQNGTWFDPTLVHYRASAGSAESDPRQKYVSQAAHDYWRKHFRVPSAEAAAMRLQALEIFQRLVSRMNVQRVRLLAGTDLGGRDVFPGFSLHDELELLVASGLSPAAALRTATLNPAIFFDRQKHWGSVDVGKVGELVLLEGDPLADIRNTRRVWGVMTGGRFYSRQELDRALEQAASQQ